MASSEIKCLVCGCVVEQPPLYDPGCGGHTIHQAARNVCYKCALKILAAKLEHIFIVDYCAKCASCPNLKSLVQYNAELIITQRHVGGTIAKRLLGAYFRAGWFKRRRMRKAIKRYLDYANV